MRRFLGFHFIAHGQRLADDIAKFLVLSGLGSFETLARCGIELEAKDGTGVGPLCEQ